MLMGEIMNMKIPGILLKDNTGCIYFIKNQVVSQQTKHIKMQMHFICNMYNIKEIDVAYVWSEENELDIMTKNDPEKLHLKFAL